MWLYQSMAAPTPSKAILFKRDNLLPKAEGMSLCHSSFPVHRNHKTRAQEQRIYYDGGFYNIVKHFNLKI
jgi:hypothetical protein